MIFIAYEILSEKNKKEFYDKYGMRGIEQHNDFPIINYKAQSLIEYKVS